MFHVVHLQLTCHTLVCSMKVRRMTSEWILTTLATCVIPRSTGVYGPLEWTWMMKMYAICLELIRKIKIYSFLQICHLFQAINWSCFILYFYRSTTTKALRRRAFKDQRYRHAKGNQTLAIMFSGSYFVLVISYLQYHVLLPLAGCSVVTLYDITLS